jgi:hypothetical protein
LSLLVLFQSVWTYGMLSYRAILIFVSGVFSISWEMQAVWKSNAYRNKSW